MLNVGIIGAGRIGKLHAENLVRQVNQVNVIGIADVYEAAAQDVAERLSILKVTSNPSDLIHDDSIEAIIICSSTDTHAPLIIESAQAGKHIFCEKPIDHSLDKIDSALDAVEKAGVKLQIGFNRRFDANFRRVRQAVESGEIGTPHLMHIISRDPAPPPIDYIKVSGGIFLDMTIHDFDMARYLIGSEVEEVYASAGVMVDPAIGEADDVDTLMVMLRFENGVIGMIQNSRQAVYGYDQRAEVFGSGGSISTQNNYPNNAILQTKESVRQADLPHHFFLERYKASFIQEMDDFADAVLNDKLVPVTAIDGRIPVVMGLAARQSYDENRPVRLDEIG